MYPINYPTQYPSQTAININPFSGAQGFQTAVPLPTQQQVKTKIINRVDDITPNDVPMDGTAGIFPLSDYSEIYVKQWKSDGTIKTVKFIPEQTVEDETPKRTELDDLKEYLDKKFEAISKSTSKPKKEVIPDG